MTAGRMKPAQREQAHHEADLRATRTVGWVLLVPGVVLLLPAVVLLIDLLSPGAPDRFADQPFECAVVLGVPLVVAGVRRLRNPERYRGHHGDRNELE